jgi:Na+-driven multidrug efflux pump
MALRDRMESWRKRLAPFANAAVVIALVVAIILFAPARGAAAVLGIMAGVFLGYSLMARAREEVQIAVLWSFIAVTADAAYARLNDLAPVTLAGALTKIIDAVIKLADPLIHGLGLTSGDPRVKVAAVAPDFVWALILALIATLVIPGIVNRSR